MADRIHHDELISELLARKPHLRWVFDRYGLRGCGGVSGPPESIRFFAQTHGVDENQLLNELAGASNRPARPVAAHRVDSAYRLFFAAGAVTALSAGALLGTWFMFRMGASGSYFEPGIHRLNAHAFAMIYGFVGAFVIGFGYQALPRFKHTVVRDPALVPITFALLVGGVTLRFFGQFFAHDESFTSVVYNPYGAGLAVAGTVLTFGAFLLFGIELLRTYRSSGKKIEEYDRWVFASLFWFVVSLALSGVYYLVLLQARDFSGLVLRVSTLQDALRNVQLFGAVSMVVLGVMQRFLNPFLDHRMADIAMNHAAKKARRIGGLLDMANESAPGHPAPTLIAIRDSGLEGFRWEWPGLGRRVRPATLPLPAETREGIGHMLGPHRQSRRSNDADAA